MVHTAFLDGYRLNINLTTTRIGLFLGSGRSLAGAGPGGAVLCYVLMGTGELLLTQLCVIRQPDANTVCQSSHFVGYKLPG